MALCQKNFKENFVINILRPKNMKVSQLLQPNCQDLQMFDTQRPWSLPRN